MSSRCARPARSDLGPLSQDERAIQDYDKAIGLNAQYSDAYLGRAMAHTLLGRDAEAQQDVDRAVGLGVDAEFLQSTIELVKGQR